METVWISKEAFQSRRKKGETVTQTIERVLDGLVAGLEVREFNDAPRSRGRIKAGRLS